MDRSGARDGHQFGRMQQLVSGGNYSSTESDPEDGAAVYESLTQSRKAAADADAEGRLRKRGTGPGRSSEGLIQAAVPFYPDGREATQLRSTNLDDPSRANYCRSQLYELLRLSSGPCSPEIDDVTCSSETSNECPTATVPSSSSDSRMHCHPFYPCGVLEGEYHLPNSHSQSFYRTRPLYYYQSQDGRMLDEVPDKHLLASSPTTTSSDRSLLPLSCTSSVNIGKVNNNFALAPSMRGVTEQRPRPVSEHYLANSILRSTAAGQCPLHTGTTTGSTTYPSRTIPRPSRTAASKSRIVTWRNVAAVLAIICLAMLAALAYFAVIAATSAHQKEETSRCLRPQQVVSPNRFQNGVPYGPNLEADPWQTQEKYPSQESELLPKGSPIPFVVAGRSFWFGRYLQPKTGLVAFNLTVPSGAGLIVYGKKDSPPTHLDNDFTKSFRGRKTQKRHVDEQSGSDKRVFSEKLDEGVWFIAVFNDMPEEEQGQLSIEDAGSSFCVQDDCGDHGSCIEGICQCQPGFTGPACSQMACPVICNGHGRYVDGRCECAAGWKGPDCDVPQTQCADPTCSGHGQCSWNGKCQCDVGFSGDACQIVECESRCSEHGVCINGTCFCQPGYQGASCSIVVSDSRQMCSLHGTYNAATKKCECEAPWTGNGCETEMCRPTCGSNGRCSAGKCVCAAGWTGASCDTLECPRCGPHGRCVNGSCLCDKGWSGRLCSANGCANNCHGHGDCVAIGEGAWRCQCEAFWRGDSCAIPVEKCDDGRDNDGDGAVDCADNDCCSFSACVSDPNCATAQDPQEALLQENRAPLTASFFERTRFLIRDRPGTELRVQSYAQSEAFDGRRAAVVRGRVVDSAGVGLIGVKIRVATNESNATAYGFTLSRRDGLYDLMVNGGGSVVLLFTKPAYRQAVSILAVAWNDFIVADPVKMVRENEISRSKPDFIPAVTVDEGPCDIVSSQLRPLVYPYWKHHLSGGLGPGSLIYRDAQVLQESLNISGSSMRLGYFSSRSSSFASLFAVALTSDTLPSALTRITVRVSLAGLSEETVYDAVPNLWHVHAWNGSNAYKQQVFGFANAKVSIGYEGRSCKEIYWQESLVKMKGVDLPVSEIGGWDLNMQHRYNPEGILHRGDGSNEYYTEGALEVRKVAGSGNLRSVSCQDGCAPGPAVSGDLLAPVALVSGLDGSLYVGDFNLIRRISPGPHGNMASLLQLPSPAMLQTYYMAVHPISGQIYLSIPQMLKVISLVSLVTPPDLANNYLTKVGTGEQCVPRSSVYDCGDGMSATAASLIFPKGVAFDKTGCLYIADGGGIRMVDENNVIRTLVAPVSYGRSWQPLSCSSVFDLTDITLRWPTSLAVNPVDDSLFILDDTMLLRLDRYKKIHVLAGSSTKCSDKNAPLDSPSSIAASPYGSVYLVEGKESNWQIREISDHQSKVVHKACSCTGSQCDCTSSASTSDKILLPAAVAVGLDNVLKVADMKALKIFRLAPSVPHLNKRMEYEIQDSDRNELYTFNRFGHHQTTKNLLTGAFLHQFTYDTTNDQAKIKSVRDADGQMVIIQRGFKGAVKSLELGGGWKMLVTSSPRGLLKDVTCNNGARVSYAYDSELASATAPGLIIGKSDSDGQSYVYRYDQHGRLTEAFYPHGQKIGLAANVKDIAAITQVAGTALDLQLYGQTVFANASFPASIRLVVGTNNVTALAVNVKNAASSDPAQKLRRSVTLNNTLLFTVDYFPVTSEEIISNQEGLQLLSTQTDSSGRIILVKPISDDFAASGFSYDPSGKITKWQQGVRWTQWVYDAAGQIVKQTWSNGADSKYEYNEKKQLTKLITGSGRRFTLDYSSTGGVQSITNPKGATLMLRSVSIMNFQRLSLRRSPIEELFSQDFDDQGRVLAATYPSGARKISSFFDAQGRLEAIYYDQSSYKLQYVGMSGQPNKIVAVVGQLGIATDIAYTSAGLITERNTKYSGLPALDPVNTIWEYDEGLKLRGRKVQVGSSDVSVTEFQTDVRSGQMTHIGPFTLSHTPNGALVLFDQNAIFLSQQDSFGKLRSRVLRLQNRIVASMEMVRQEGNLLSELKIRKRDGDPQTTFSFKYDLDQQLVEVTKNKQPWWNFAYDLNGNLLTLLGNGKLTNVTVDKADRLVSVSDESAIKVDQDGFVVAKGSFSFDYNGKGRLSRVRTPTGTITYFYDEKDRLFARQTSGGETTQFVYGDPSNDRRITHLYDKSNRTLTQYFYDTGGHLIALARNGNPYYVLQSKLTLSIFDAQGNLVRDVLWTPFGYVESDSSEAFYYPFDRHSNYRDPATGLVFDENGVYDGRLGRYLNPIYPRDLRRLSLGRLNFYVYHRNDPLQTDQEKRPVLHVEDWVEVMGLGPSLRERNPLRQPVCVSPDRSTLSIVDKQCMSQQTMKKFPWWTISSPRRPRFHDPYFLPLSFGQSPSFYSKFLALSSNNSSYVDPVPTGLGPRDAADFFSSLFGSTHLLPYHLSNGTTEFVFAVKKADLLSRDRDVSRLQALVPGLTVASSRSATNPSLAVQWSDVVYNVTYASNTSAVIASIENMLRTETMRRAWLMEKERVANGQPGLIDWTTDQKNELIRTGFIAGYSGRVFPDAASYPRLATDASLVTFIAGPM